jgi:CheY-like chemotaxis protein
MSRPFLLLVDDSPEMGLIVASLGKRAGCEVRVCPDAETAWEALPQRQPDLVLLDVNLPGISGIDWLRRVRGASSFAGLRVALYTHWGLPGDIVAGLDAGADFLFDKDLASRPTDWQSRLCEILSFQPQTKPGAGKLGEWTNCGPWAKIQEAQSAALSPQDWSFALNQAIQHPSFRRLPREVVAVILRRALTQAFTSRILPEDFDAWISRDSLDPFRLPPSLAHDSPLHLAVCLADQLECLLGNEAGAAFRDALAAALSGFQGRF